MMAGFPLNRNSTGGRLGPDRGGADGPAVWAMDSK